METTIHRCDSQLIATVAICTYNGAARIGYVLESLVNQTLPADQWEILVVDNASTDSTVEVCEGWRDRLPVPLHIVREERQGLSYARECAGQNARGEIICFLDDDSPAERDWLACAVQAFADRPQAGCLGGKVKPIWESEPTPLTLDVCIFAHAICDHGDAPFRYTGVSDGPVGAGLCIRSDILNRIYLESQLSNSLTGRKGTSLSSGEDTALGIVVGQMGYERWYVPSLHIHHRIPAHRTSFDYLLRLYAGIGRGQAMTRRLYDRKARNPVLGALIGVKDLLRWLRGVLLGPGKKYRNKEPGLRQQLHALHQRQLWGRGFQAITGCYVCLQHKHLNKIFQG